MNVLARNWRPLLFIVLGAGAALSAYYLLHVCGDHDMLLETAKGAKVPMRCHWSEQAFIGVSGLVGLMGVAMLFFKEAGRGLSLAAAGAGLLMIVNITYLIPTCATDSMICNTSFKPGALLIAGLITLAGLISTIPMRRLDTARA